MHHAYGRQGGNRKMTKHLVRAVPRLICAALMALVVSTSTAAAEPVILTGAHNGKTIVLDKGASLIISLESNPSTGYVWQVGNNDNAILKLVGQPAFHPGPHHLIGEPGHLSFTFEAIATGSDSIELRYLRPWEKGVAPAKTFGVIVMVK
jgi:inhibitor of cysteine peptidase